jgi:putative endonuclease
VNRRAFGARGEAIAGEWYRARGYTVLDRNWRCREGELDLVLEGPGVVVFCEVKTRSSDAFGIGAEAVTREKQMRIRRLSARWLTEHRRRAGTVRFDVVSILAPRDGKPMVQVYEAAF